MLRLAFSSLRMRKCSVLGAFLALFFAAAMVCACGVLLETGIRGAIPAQRYSGTPVVVAADQQLHWTEVKHKHGKTKIKTKSKALTERAWVPTSVGRRLARVPGARVVADLVFPAVVVGQHGTIMSGADGKPTWGHGWASAALTPYSLTSGSPPRHDDEVVLDAGLAGRAGLTVGERTVVESTSAPKTYRVVGIARADAAVTGQSAMFFDGGEARRLAGHPGFVAAYGVFGITAAQAHAAVAGTGAIVSTGDDRGAVEFVEAAAARVRLISMGGAIGGTSLIVGVLVVVGTFALSIQQRRRELALLRAVGATPRQVRQMISGEAVLVGLIAGIPGSVAGVALAGVTHTALVTIGALPDTLQLARSPFPIAAAVLATVGAAWVAARVTARRSARIRPAEALTEAAVERRALGTARVASGLIVTAAAAAVTSVLRVLHTAPAAMPVTYLSVLLWMVAVALLGPLLTRAAVAMVGTLLRAFPVTGFLAAQNTRANSRRAASVITPLALLIGMILTILFIPATVQDAARAQTKAGVRAEYVLGSHGPGVPDAAAQALRTVAGVHAVTEVLPTTIWVGKDKRSALGLTPAGVTSTLDPDVTAGSLARLGGGTIAMSALAEQGRHIGDTVQLTLGDGTKTHARLVAVYSRGLGFGDTLLAYNDLADHVDDPLARTVLINGTASREQIRTPLAGVAGLTLAGRSGYDAIQAASQQTNTDVNLIFMALIIAFTAIAVINTLAMAIGDRSREVSLMRLIGTTARQVLRTLRWELALIVVIATALGTAAAWLTLDGFSEGMVGSGAPAFILTTYALVLAGATALGLVGTALPARMVLRRQPAEDIHRT